MHECAFRASFPSITSIECSFLVWGRRFFGTTHE